MADLDMNMNKLREEAARRAREMQARAHIPPPRKTKEPPSQQPSRELPQEETAPKAVCPSAAQEENGVLGAFIQDKERTIILALLLLLSGDKENHELLFALMFLLM